jgi:hypothetical protein
MGRVMPCVGTMLVLGKVASLPSLFEEKQRIVTFADYNNAGAWRCLSVHNVPDSPDHREIRLILSRWLVSGAFS